MITVIIPCFKSKDHILGVLARIGDNVSEIIVIDDCCPEGSGKVVEKSCQDPRVRVVFHAENKGVGGAMKTGFTEALKGRSEIFVKIDSDGQMPPEILYRFVDPIKAGLADYCKGNRFYSLDSLKDMPTLRLLGNSMLSFFTKLSCGYWNVMDPTNGYIAIHRKVIEHIPVHRLEDGFFFESNLLFRMNTINAVVVDIPMDAIYANEISNLSIRSSLPTFLGKNIKMFIKRIFYSYFLRDFNISSVNLLLGILFFVSGIVYGYSNHLSYSRLSMETPTGVQLITMLLLILGFQMLLSFISVDMHRMPTKIIHDRLPGKKEI